jgi:hypothetical protein
VIDAMGSRGTSSLAAIGLAARTASPVLLHAIRGCLHDVTLLAALLRAAPSGPAQDGAKTESRFAAITGQLKLLERNVGLLAATIDGTCGKHEAACACATALTDVVRLLQDVAARERVRLEVDLAALPSHVEAGERALQQALLVCGAWSAQQCGAGATMRFRGFEERGNAVFDFDCAAAAEEARDERLREELALLAVIVQGAGGTLSTAPRLRLEFPGARASDAAAT